MDFGVSLLVVSFVVAVGATSPPPSAIGVEALLICGTCALLLDVDRSAMIYAVTLLGTEANSTVS